MSQTSPTPEPTGRELSESSIQKAAMIRIPFTIGLLISLQPKLSNA
jgi:hypothetical protein